MEPINPASASAVSPELLWDGDLPSGISLRTELSVRSLNYARAHGHLYDRSDGAIPSILFGCDETGRHGNFHPSSYRCIVENAAWAKRTQKTHTAYRRARARANWAWKELDCSNSSDALLMNVFCYPQLIQLPAVQALLGCAPQEMPQFGFRPRVALANGRLDTSEIDMKLGHLLVEAKLTESHFQYAEPRLLHRYRDLQAVFRLADLPVYKGRYVGYQLIRGVLAAQETGLAYCVLCDRRRSDLIETWYGVQQAVRHVDVRCRLKLLTWQELMPVLPGELQGFLAVKYGFSA